MILETVEKWNPEKWKRLLRAVPRAHSKDDTIVFAILALLHEVVALQKKLEALEALMRGRP